MKNIAKLTSHGCYLDCDFVTAKYPEDETHIVGNVAEYVYDLEQKISDLEAKLAESETLIQRLQSVIDNLRNKPFASITLVDAINNVYEPIYKVKFDECEQLKQQLAEKEAENKKLSLLYFGNENTETVLTTDKMINYIKISFCIEQLEKVKEYIKTNLMSFQKVPIIQEINNQIKQLKEMK